MDKPVRHAAIELGLIALVGLGASCRQTTPEPASERRPIPATAEPLHETAEPDPRARDIESYTPAGCQHTVEVPYGAKGMVGGTSLGPSAEPDHVHAGLAGPAESSFAVNWRTGRRTTASEMLYGTDRALVAAASGPDEGVLWQRGHSILYRSHRSGGLAGTGLLGGHTITRVHEVHVCGLEPATRYYYKVGAAGAFSEVYDLRTAPPAGSAEPFRFAVLGDGRGNVTVLAQIQQRLLEAGAHFQLFTGDIVSTGSAQSEWDALFEAQSPLGSAEDALARVPLLATNGNHDMLAVNYLGQLIMPQERSEGESDPEEWYSLDYAGAHIVVLNDYVRDDEGITGAQRRWLEQDLAAVDRERTPWLFVMHHQPPYSCSAHGSNLALRRAWQPLYDRYQVDMVFNGHDHNYERSLPIRGLDADTDEGTTAAHAADGSPIAQSGTVYVVAGASGAPLYGSSTRCYHTRVAESVYNYVIVSIEGRTMEYRAYRLDGSLLDAFDYSK